MEVEDEGRSGEEAESESWYEEYTDNEGEVEPRLKPVFIHRKEQITVQERGAEALEQEAKRMAEEWLKYTLQIGEEEAKKELEEGKQPLAALDALVEMMRRMGRSVVEEEEAGMERNPTEQERRASGKGTTNRAGKGKYKFLQQHCHHGAFLRDEEEEGQEGVQCSGPQGQLQASSTVTCQKVCFFCKKKGGLGLLYDSPSRWEAQHVLVLAALCVLSRKGWEEPSGSEDPFKINF
uniref:Uncharacterized protein n=1 Tax=Corvus moneduloides TaxID=1196302 RepID=A0A8U7P876_CORMO